MDCREVSELVYRHLDDELGDELLLTFHSHVRCCPTCEQRARFARRFLATVRERADRRCAPDGLRDRILKILPHRQILT